MTHGALLHHHAADEKNRFYRYIAYHNKSCIFLSWFIFEEKHLIDE
jgi:hypothetical protein